MRIEQARVLRHEVRPGTYRLLELKAPEIAGRVCPGQFVHLRIPALEGLVLRRPFSVFRAGGGNLSILYKPVGRGTEAMTRIAPGAEVSLMGPLGNGFPLDHGDRTPVLVAGGYGVAPLCLLAARLKARGMVFIGAVSAEHVLCADDFRALDWNVRIATEDGSLGVRGLVTDALDRWAAEESPAEGAEYYACGPDAMLQAVGRRAISMGRKAWLSLEKHMGCGVGACLTCVQRIRGTDGAETWKRVCCDGPVFEAREIMWG